MDAATPYQIDQSPLGLTFCPNLELEIPSKLSASGLKFSIVVNPITSRQNYNESYENSKDGTFGQSTVQQHEENV